MMRSAWLLSLILATSCEANNSFTPHSYAQPRSHTTTPKNIAIPEPGDDTMNPSSTLDPEERYSRSNGVDPLYYDTEAASDYAPPPYADLEPPSQEYYYPDDHSDERHMMGETTVQERVDQWRENQMENSGKYQNSVRDEQGRVKLLTSIGKGSRAVIFFMFMWRDIYFYELASNIASSVSRLFVTVPMLVMFVLNMAGFVVSLTTSTNAGKKRLKAILNLDKFIEVFMMVYAFLRLSIFPSRLLARDVYIGSLIHSLVFLIQAQACTRFSWDEKSAVPLTSYHDTYRRSDE